MPKREKLVKGYLTEDEKIAVKQWCDETGETQSEAVRNALMEYIDHDRTARVEDEVRDLHAKVDDVLAHLDGGDSHTHKGGQSALEKAREIVRQLQRNNDEVVKNGDLERVIENNAGIDERTIKKYKGIFRKRGLLFEHPGERPIWTFETDLWTNWLIEYASVNGGKEALEDTTEPYPVDVTEDFDGNVRIEVNA